MSQYNVDLEQLNSVDDDGEHRPGHGWLGQNSER